MTTSELMSEEKMENDSLSARTEFEKKTNMSKNHKVRKNETNN